MKNTSSRTANLLRASAAGLSLSFALLATPAMAQDAGAETNDETIIVTATRRSEALSDVPIAVSAVTGETLEKTGATDVRALGQVAPSLLVSGATSEVNFSARIRGIGTVGENPGLESSVGLFIDGVYRSRTGVGLSELGDIERVEVLRGPQGTLFGRNSTAGLINIVTKGPDLGAFGAKGSVSFGNYDYWRVDGMVNARSAKRPRCASMASGKSATVLSKMPPQANPTLTTATAGWRAASCCSNPARR